MIDSSIRKARKIHLCDLCNGEIRQGQEYHDYVQARNGIHHTRTHKTCQALLQGTDSFDDDNCFSGDSYDMIRERANEHGWRWLLGEVRHWWNQNKKGGA
jgi:hypothetical protein